MKIYARYLCVLPLALSALTLLGWLLAIDFLKHPFAQTVPMNPMTALSLLLASSLLLNYCWGDNVKKLNILTIVAGIAFGLIAILKLVSLFAINLHVDTWLFHDGVVAENTNGNINRMAPNTAFSLVLLSGIFFALNTTSTVLKNMANYLAVIVFIIGMFAFIGYLYQVKEYYGLLSYLPMSLQTAVSFILLAVAILLQNSNYAFMRVISSNYGGGKIARRLVPVAILAPVTLGFIRLYLLRQFPVAVELGVAALVTSIVIIFLIMVWWVSRWLNISDAAHQQLKDSYQKMVQEIQDYAIISMDTGGNILNWNLGAEKIKGYRASEIVGKNFRAFYPAKEREDMHPEKLLDEALTNGRAVSEGWRVKKDGSTFWASVVITALHDEKNNVIGLSKVTRDLTEIKKRETELQRQAELFNVLPDAVIYGKADFTIASLNKAAQQLFETEAAQAVGLKVSQMVEIDMSSESLNEARQHVWNGKGVWKGEANFTTRTGKKTAVLITLKATEGGLGQGNSWVGIYTDVTALKRTQLRLESALEGMVAGLWDWNIIDDSRWWSPRYFELLGYENQEIKPSAETLARLVHPEDASAVFESIKNNLAKPEGFVHLFLDFEKGE